MSHSTQHLFPMQPALRNADVRNSKSAELTLSDLYKSIKRRRRLLFSITLACFLLGVVVCLMKTPRYEASAEVQVQKDNPGPLGISSVINEGPMPSDTIDYNITLQTDAEVLKSEPLAVKAIEDLHLEQTHDYRPRFNPLGMILSLLAPKAGPEAANVPLEQAPVRRARLIKIFAQHLTVKVQDGTRLISVRYSDPDPRLATAVVNHLVEGLRNYDSDTRKDSTQEAYGWLHGQADELRNRAKDADARVADIQKETGVFTMGDTDVNGHVISVNVVLARLQDLNNSLTAAQTNRILKEAIHNAAEKDGAESISGLAGNILSGAAPEVVNSLNNIQTLRAQEANLKATKAQNESRYGANFPAMVQLNSQIAEIDRAIAAEQGRIKDHANSDYLVAQQTEAKLRALYDKQKAQAAAMNNKTIDYMVAKQEADQEHSVYNDIYRRINEAAAVAGLSRSNVIVMDPGSVPGKPKSPNVPIYLAASLLGGLLLGASAALIADSRDRRLHEIEQLEEDLAGRPYAVITAPGREASSHRALSDTEENPSADPLYQEALRSLRTAIINGSGIAQHSVIQITGCCDDGMTTSFGVHLAEIFALQGYKTLLVEADMRKPQLKSILALRSEEGLASLIKGNAPADVIHKSKNFESLELLPAGKEPALAAELLGSDAMKSLVAGWRTQYDYILIIAPPVLSVADAILLRSFSDLVLLLADFGQTERQAIVHAHRSLATAQGKPAVGVVLCGVPQQSNAYREYFGSWLTPYGADAKESA